MSAFYTLFYRIPANRVEAVLSPDFEPDENTSLWLRSIGDLELDFLWCLLPGGESMGTLMEDVAASVSPDEMAFKAPDNFTNCIHALDDDTIDHVAQQWSGIDELANTDPADLAKIIFDIRKLVNDAKLNNEIVVFVPS